MRNTFRRLALCAALAPFVLAAIPPAAAGGAGALVGSYKLAKRVKKDGTTVTSPEVIGFITFTKSRRSVIMRWPAPDGAPVSIAYIADYELSGEKYCESVVYGVQSNLGAPGVSYDTPTETKECNAAISDATGVSFDVPREKLRLQFVKNGLIATTPRWTDHWEKVK